VQVEHCGVCHTGLHALRAHDQHTRAPLVSGHGCTGMVAGIGPEVTTFSVGDRVALGSIVDSCGGCAMCEAGQEDFCHSFPTLTYSGTDRQDGTPTLGGYSREYVVHDAFACPLPSGLDPVAAAPLMCAGTTVREPLRSLGVDPGSRVAVAGLGGLGHLAVKTALAAGATTTFISRTQDKRADARKLGADDLIASPRRIGASRLSPGGLHCPRSWASFGR
jgi:alcohol dehydrogenase (NADP+)